MRQVRRYHDGFARQRERRDRRRLAPRWQVVHALSRATRPLHKPVQLGLAMARQTRRCGVAVRERTGVSLRRQVRQQAAVYRAYGITPDFYYLFELYRDEHRGRAGQYLTHHQMVVLLNELIDTTCPDSQATLRDKERFYRHCRQYGLATIPILAALNCGQVRLQVLEAGEGLPPADLFVKPARGFGGWGAARWTYDEGYYLRGDQRLDGAALLQHLASRATRSKLLLQPRIRNHAAIVPFAGETLANVRLITCRRADRRLQVLIAFIGVARTERAVSNTASGPALAIPIDAATGQMGRAVDVHPGTVQERWARHPDTDAAIEGVMLPDWDQAVALALEAHRSMPDLPFAGWDVGLTPEGPLLIEGNTGWGAKVQAIHRQPLGDTPFPECYLAHTERYGSPVTGQ